MKKIVIILVFAITTLNAQTETKINPKSEFNQWSIELDYGINKAQKPITSGYGASAEDSFVVDLGVRYMFNNKFGLKTDFGYNSMSSDNFESKYYRMDVQGVANLGRIMNFESWTQRIGLLGHSGIGIAKLHNENNSIEDGVFNIVAGVTGQFKISDRMVLTSDFTSIFNLKQSYAFDMASSAARNGFNGILFNGTVGLTFYLGKKDKHIDWAENNNEIEILNERIKGIEAKVEAKEKEKELNNLEEKAKVEVEEEIIDINDNNIPDNLEKYMLKNYMLKTYKTPVSNDNELAKTLINSGSVAVFFDFDQFVALDSSISEINFILTYLRNNPEASIDIVGHTDGLGRPEYNKKLSNSRAYHIKGILVKANISPSRINTIAAGVDTTLDSSFASNRKLARRVSFFIK